jgi:hypothetical protein
MLWWLVQDETSIAAVVNMGMLPLVLLTRDEQYRRIFWNCWNQHTESISASGCRSFGCLESVAGTAAVTLPSAAGTGPAIVCSASGAHNSALQILTTLAFVIFTDEAQFTIDGIQNVHRCDSCISGSPPIFGPIFVLQPTYFPTGVQ